MDEIDIIQLTFEDSFRFIDADKSAFEMDIRPFNGGDERRAFVSLRIIFDCKEVVPTCSLVKSIGCSDHQTIILFNSLINNLKSGESLFQSIMTLIDDISALNESDSLECGICLMALTDVYASSNDGMKLVSCNHSFHTSCLLFWWFGIENNLTNLVKDTEKFSSFFAIDHKTLIDKAPSIHCPICRSFSTNTDVESILKPILEGLLNKITLVKNCRMNLESLLLEIFNNEHSYNSEFVFVNNFENIFKLWRRLNLSMNEYNDLNMAEDWVYSRESELYLKYKIPAQSRKAK